MQARASTARLLAATAMCGIFTTPAFSQTYGLQSTDSTPVSNPSGSTLYGTLTGVYSTGSSLDLDNAGTIRGDGPNLTVNDSNGGVIISGGPAQITNSGDISGARAGIATMYFNNNGVFEGRAIGSTVTNSGSIIGDFGPGVRLIGGGSVTNSGYIAGRVGPGADGIAIFAYNGQDTTGMTGIGSVTNLAGGLIEGNRTGVFIIGGGTIGNAGSIDHGARIIGTGPGQTGAITNSGTIFNGGIEMSSLAWADVANSGHTVVIGLAGVGTANVTNSGTVDYFTSFNTVGTANVNNSGSIGDGLIFNKTTTANVTNSGSIVATNTPDVVGTTQDAVFSDAALTLTNTATGSIDGFVSGIRSNGASLTLDNAGTIRGNGDQAFRANSAGGVVLQGGPGFITNSGLISGQQFGITTIYVTTDPLLGLAIGSTVDNSGSIIGDNNDGIRLIGGGSVINSGYIAGRVDAGADGISMFSFDGQDLASFDVIGNVTNLTGGVIEGNRFGVIMSNGGMVDNAGTISGNSGSILLQAQSVGSELPRNGTVTNSGTLNGTVQFNNLASASVINSGTVASLTGNGIFTTAPGGSLSVDNQAGGSITGAINGIRSDGSSMSLNNAGIIFGLGTADDIEIDANGGVILSGGPASITNSGSIFGAKFGIATVYFTNPDNSITGLTTDTTVTNSGSIVGEGNDGIRLHGGGTVTNSGYIAGRVRVGADGVSILAFDGQDLSGLGSAGIGTVNNLLGGVIEGHREGIIISDGGTVNNAGTINGGYRGAIVLEARDAGRFGTLTNSGTINGVVDFIQLASASLANSGAIVAPAGAAIHGWAFDGYMGPLAVTNDATGTIIGRTSGIFSEGASLSLTNAGTIRGNGMSISALVADAGILVTGGPASITNSGNISGAGFGITTGVYSDFFTNAASNRAIGSTVINSGSIIGDNNDGIKLIGGGTVTNSGYIAGNTRFSADGVSILAFDGQDLSGLPSAGIGTVNNLAGGVIEGHREGIIISDGGTVNNAGTINGGYRGAIVLEARDAGRIGTLTNSGTINGTVDFIQLASASLANSGAILAPAGPAVHGWAFDGYMGPLAVTNVATGTIIGGTSGIFSEGASLSLTNAGTIRGNGASGTLRVADAGILITGGPAMITNSGNISGAGFGITTGIYSDFFTNAASNRAIGSTVTNSGSIIGDSNDGVRLIGGGTVTNSGLISGRVGAVADGVSAFAFDGQDITGSTIIGSVTNLLGGTIDGNRFGVVLSGGGAISNAGTISGGSGAILIQTGTGEAGRTGTVNNSGTINGSTTLSELANASVVNSGTMASSSTAGIRSSLTNGPMSINNGATGSITGATSGILSAGSSLSLTNAGTIRGNGSYDGFAASPDGGIDVAGGSATIVNSGTISGQRFGITTSYVLNPSTNLLEGRAVGSTVTNSGTIIGDTDIGVRLIGGGTVTNSGYIAGRVGATADGVWMMAFNDQPLNSFATIGSVTNLAGGVIEGNRRGITLANGGSVNNAGTISGNAAAVRIVALAGDTGRTGSVTNSGTLNGAVEFLGLANGSLTNSGSINGAASSTGAVYTDSPLAVTNAFTGSITGSSYGIKAQSSLTLNNAGTIIALAAPGTSDGFGVFGIGVSTIANSGHVTSSVNGITALGLGSTVNNTGTVATTAGSGVAVAGSLTNSGAISSGVWGIEVQGGGSVTNTASGSISGGTIGAYFTNNGSLNNAGTISVTNASAAVIMGAFGTGPAMVTNSGAINGSVQFNGSLIATLNNSGSITARGSAVAVSSDSPTNLVNSGSISTTGATAVSLLGTNTADTVTLQTGSSISGAIDGGTGNDTLRVSGTVATPTAVQTVGHFDRFETFNVLGGYWTAPGNTGSFNSTTINGGALAVNGTLSSPITVNAGAMLAGIGTITGAVTMNSGGLLSPGGSSIGTLNISGNVAFNAGSTLSVQTNPNGTSDKLAVSGGVTISKGSSLQVLAGIFPNYPATSTYLVLTATGGISGKFDSVITDYAYFKATVNTQQKGTITVQIAPNGKPLPSAATASTFSTATAVESLGGSSALYQSVIYQSLTGARQAFNALSGSAYARLDAMMDRDVGNVRLGFDGADPDAPALSWAGVNSLAARGMHSGLQRRHGALSLFMVGGRYTTSLSDASISGDIDSRFLAGAAAYKSGRFRALAAVTSAWHDVSVTRTIVFPGFAERSEARYRATTHRLELEGAYDLSREAINIAPYAGYAHLMISSPAFGETGGLSALTFGRENRAMDQLRLGVRAATKFHLGGVLFAPHVDADVERVWGAGDPARTARFAGANGSFDNGSLGFNRRASSIDARLDLAVGQAILSADYRAHFGDQWRERSASLTAAVHF
ncbi:hypothetical protein [Sphingomonas sp.]|uniref:hypothetical protein n=1 Tax=Sphingomonas sp. TaxID=28214 RepID=UPI0038A32AAF